MSEEMTVTSFSERLWRWTCKHPAWTSEADRPDGWSQDVGSVFWAPEDEDRLIIVDPLVPAVGLPDRNRFFRALDRDVERYGLPVTIMVLNRHHGRSAADVFDRYHRQSGAEVWAPTAAVPHVAARVTHPFREGDALPADLTAIAVEGFGGDEVVLHLAGAKALVFADAVIGAGGGGVRVAPPSWASEESRQHYERRFRPSLTRLLDLEADILLPSHGEPVATGGWDALARALDAPAWGS